MEDSSDFETHLAIFQLWETLCGAVDASLIGLKASYCKKALTGLYDPSVSRSLMAIRILSNIWWSLKVKINVLIPLDVRPHIIVQRFKGRSRVF